MEAVLGIAAMVVGVAALFVAYVGWRAALTDKARHGRPWYEVRSLTRSAQGRLALVLMVLAAVVGVAAAVWLSDRAG